MLSSSHARWWILRGVAWLVIVLCVASAGQAAGVGGQQKPDPQALAVQIDKRMARRWEETGVVPAAPASDAQFFRRIYLDIAGRIPAAAEVREFLADSSPDKRRQAVDHLLESSNYVSNFSEVWRSLFIPEADGDFQVRYITLEFQAWLRKKLATNAPYDEIVREILTVPLTVQNNRGVYAFYSGQREPQPTAFFAAKEIKPEGLAAATARLFMGIQVECAQCHDHPHADWGREDFWAYAAFFSAIRRSNGSQGTLGAITEFLGIGQQESLGLMIPDTDRTVSARFLDGTAPEAGTKPRAALANWLLSDDNPYFARAAVNRIWAHFFGRGIVEPVDDLDAANPPSHPELLDELAHAFAASGYDLHFLVRAITASRTYQLSSAVSHPTQEDPRLFARMGIKPLTARQLFDSLATATGRPNDNSAEDPFFEINQGSPRAEFRQRFADLTGGSGEYQSSVLQALAMMNGELVAEATDLSSSATLSAIADFPLMSMSGRIESLFLAVLGRWPAADELARMQEYVERGGVANNQRQALADVFWVLLNTSEFSLNH